MRFSEVEQIDLVAVRQLAERAERFERVQVRLADLGAVAAEVLHGDVLLAAAAAARKVLRRRLAQSRDRDEGRTELFMRNFAASERYRSIGAKEKPRRLNSYTASSVTSRSSSLAVLSLLRRKSLIFRLTASVPPHIMAASKPPFWLRR